MRQKIIDGKVPEITDPNKAKDMIVEGKITWDEAKLIAKGGNLTSLKFDALDGIITTMPVAGISFVIVFAQAKWSGSSTKDAALMATKSGLTTLCMGTIVYAGSQQFAKLFTKELAKVTGQKVVAANVAKNAGLVISFGIIVLPDMFNALSGRISSQQLLKNSVVAGGGILGGVAAGAAAGSFVPGVGNVVGAIVGGIAASAVTKKVMEYFIEDDRVEMCAILKEEYIDVVMSITLTEEEFNDIQDLIFNNSLEGNLKSMYAARNKSGSRLYAREKLVEDAVISVIKKRDVITQEVIENGIDDIAQLSLAS